MLETRTLLAVLTGLALALPMALAPPPTTAAEVLAGPIPARVLDVIDGDTISVQARIWLG